MPDGIKLFSGNANRKLGQEIAHVLVDNGLGRVLVRLGMRRRLPFHHRVEARGHEEQRAEKGDRDAQRDPEGELHLQE